MISINKVLAIYRLKNRFPGSLNKGTLLYKTHEDGQYTDGKIFVDAIDVENNHNYEHLSIVKFQILEYKDTQGNIKTVPYNENEEIYFKTIENIGAADEPTKAIFSDGEIIDGFDKIKEKIYLNDKFPFVVYLHPNDFVCA